MTDLMASTSKTVASEASASQPAKAAGNDKSSIAAGKRPQHGRREDPPDVRISKALSYILRHGAAKESLTMRPDGFIRVDELLKRPKLQKENVDLPTLQRIVAENAKQRFALKEETDATSGEPILWIRANQGHSVAVEDLELVNIQNADEVPCVVHGTFTRHWDSIRKGGLKVMNRHHIHCASGLYGQEGVISGMRATCDLFIEIDVAKAMADGIVFEKSANGVILTKGKNGILSPEYFKTVTNKKGEILAQGDEVSMHTVQTTDVGH